MISKNQIRKIFENIAEAHDMIHSFGYGKEWNTTEVPVDQDKINYPLLWIVPMETGASKGELVYRYQIAVMDLVRKGKENEMEVESDTHKIITDIISLLNAQTFYPSVSLERAGLTIREVYHEKYQDELTGHACMVSLKTNFDANSCAVPGDGFAEPVVPSNCSPATLNINGVFFGLIESGATYDLEIRNTAGSLVGSEIGGDMIAPDATAVLKNSATTILLSEGIPSGASEDILAPDATAVLKNTAGGVISSEAIPAGVSEDITAPDATAVVKNSLGTTLISESIMSGASEDIVAADASAVLKDSAGLTLLTEPIPAGGSENIIAPDATAVLKKSDATTLRSEAIPAGGSENLTIADSSVQNSDATYSAAILAEGSLILPGTQVNVDSVDIGDVISVKTINVDLTDGTDPVSPVSVSLINNNILIEVAPAGGGPYDVSSIDRYGNTLPTISIGAAQTLNWKTYDFADFFLSQMDTTPTPAEISYINYIVDQYVAAGIWEKLLVLFPLIGGTANNNSLNLKYPFKTRDAMQGYFIGSPTHNANGLTTSGTSCMYCHASQYHIPDSNWHLSLYSRTNSNPNSAGATDIAMAESNRCFEILSTSTRSLLRGDAANFFDGAPTWTSEGNFLLNCLSGTNGAKFYKNAGLLNQFTNIGSVVRNGLLMIGGHPASDQGIQWAVALSRPASRNYAMASYGYGLTAQQVIDKNTIDQAAQAILNRNV